MSEWTPPSIDVELLDDQSPEAPKGFLSLRRRKLRNRYADGSTSDAYFYDSVDRRAMDAVVLVLHDGKRMCVRSSLRPPVAFRHELSVPRDADHTPVLWEIPAGLIEPDEIGEAGLRACASRETLEETGLQVAPEVFEPLGPAVFLSPGVVAERLYYFMAKVDPSTRGVPTEDGTPVEARMEVRFVEFGELLRACDAGHIGDAKSEVGIRRFLARHT